jgi:hypothetical protein
VAKPIISGDWGPKLFWILLKACIKLLKRRKVRQ